VPPANFLEVMRSGRRDVVKVGYEALDGPDRMSVREQEKAPRNGEA
jgi:hypothetical protein